jgi:CDP-glucose 4,6-dehydratase
MEDMEMNKEFWQNKKVFITGHTGFKGGWLSIWLQSMGAEVHGYSLSPSTETNFYGVAKVAKGMATSTIADVRDGTNFSKTMMLIEPEIVFHLAAQPLVRYSYEQPLETYMVNVIGTVNMLEAVRQTPSVKAVVNITTDKCYENREWLWGYRENEAMGGHDPYSSSKACSELVTSAYRKSFMESSGISLASARAGNVIGGGDWSDDRLVPDILKTIDNEEILNIRYPNATRPWQHVLEPVYGYLLLAEKLFIEGSVFAEGWNFGPADDDAKSVKWIVEQIAEMHKNLKWECDDTPQPHEASYLKLDSSKAKNELEWEPSWNLKTALEKTLEWHEAWRNNDDMASTTISQIEAYQSDNN